ncbi:YD repeat-containing protein [Povalibacter uvarum]|uniref:YD repeat-containing protein n=1 Tax=Povalibacter uvarum TaxID=732238 RepID=A0A841HER1_9GAMM|nr:RHS repeat protein [Povalibacter uvarum]MBB6091183.1 YD repeat-containing protein [Povalibacter uvarum]
MAAIVAGHGLGLFNTSAAILGGSSSLGLGLLGQAGGRSFVNAATGNLILQFRDEQLAGRGTDLLHLRTYNSRGAWNDADTDGWRWDGERSVRFSGVAPNRADTSVVRTDGDGNESTYNWDSARNKYVSTAGGGAHDTLEFDQDTQQWLWTEGSSRAQERYASATTDGAIGRLESQRDRSGNTITYGYDAANRLKNVTDQASGQRIELIYATVPGTSHVRLQRVDTYESASDATPTREVEYRYDSAGRLEQVRTDLNAAGGVYVTTYAYDGASERIASITQSDGSSVSFTYDAQGRIATVTDASGVQTFSYFTDPRRTDVVDALGHVWSFFYDDQDQLIEMRSPAPQANAERLSTKYEYNDAGDVWRIIDARGHAVVYEYDQNGNRTLERDALGNTVSRTYNAQNQVLTETRRRTANEPFTTRFVYDGESRLRFVVSAEGRVSESRFGSNGLMSHAIEYTGARYDVAALDPGSGLNEAQLVSWVGALQDKDEVQLTRLEYDYRGNLSKRTAYAVVDEAGEGVLDAAAVVTQFVYSGYGELLQTIAMRGATRSDGDELASYAYDGMGRETSRVDRNGTTTTQYDGVARTISIQTSAGLTEVRSYDVRGRLIGVALSSAADETRTTTYVYDAAGRQRMVIDAQGNRRFSFYDDAGRLVQEVDSVGAVTAYEYDADSRVVKQTRYVDAADTSEWTIGDPPVVTKTQLIIGETGDVRVDPDHDRTTTLEYDAAGRLVREIESGGTVTETAYDGASRAISRQTVDRLTRYFYDRDGNRIGMVDALGYLTEYKLDAAGRLVETVRYAARANGQSGGRPQANESLPPLDDVLTLWRPADGERLYSYRYYDAQGRLVGHVDERGFLTETLYDEQGNAQQTVQYMERLIVAPDDTLTSLKERAGEDRRITTVEYDEFGRVQRAVAHDGTVTNHEYDEAGRLIRQVRAEGSERQRGARIRYNAFNEITGEVGGVGDASGLSTDEAIVQFGMQYVYDTLGRRIRGHDSKGNTTLYYYDSEDRLTHTVKVVNDEEGVLAGEVSETSYTTFGQVAATRRYATRLSEAVMDELLLDGGGGAVDDTLTAPLALIRDNEIDQLAEHEYDVRGQFRQTMDAERFKTTFEYDVYGQLWQQTREIVRANARVTTTQFDYDLLGQVIETTGDLGGLNHTTSTEYDAFGRVVRTVDGAGKATRTLYHDGGRFIEVRDPLDRRVTTQFDALGRVFSVRRRIVGAGEPYVQETTYRYDDTTRVMTVTTPEGIRVRTTHTEHGEVLSIEDGRGAVRSFDYDADGRLTQRVDARGQIVEHNTYDSAGRLIETRDARGVVVRYRYDEHSRVVERTLDPGGLNERTQYRFDALGRQIRVTEVGAGIERVSQLTYDRSGQLLEVLLDPEGLELTTTYAYDGLGNVVTVQRGSRAGSDQRVTLYEFDNLGRRTHEKVALRVIERTPPGPIEHTEYLTTEYRYDAAGRVSRKIDAKGASTWFVYDDAGQLTYTVNQLGEVSRNWYDEHGQVVQTRRYARSLTSQQIALLGDVVLSVPVTSDALGDQRSYFAYDEDGRQRYMLQAYSGGNWVVSESIYDANGNVVESRRYDQFMVLPANLASADRLTDDSVRTELRSLRYFEETPASLASVQRTRYAYDANDRLRFTVDALGGVAENVYDNAGNVVSRVRYAVRPALSQYSESTINAAVNRVSADNHVSHYAYDRAGRMVYSVRVMASDAAGRGTQHIVSRNRYDALGQLVATMQYAQAVGLVNDYAAATLDAAVAGTIEADPANRSSWFAYDDAGRMEYSVRRLSAGEHIVTRQVYDDTGLVVQTIAYADTVGALSSFDKAALDAAVHPGDLDRVTSFVYDSAGRRRFTVAADGALSETVYDALGQIEEQRRFALTIPVQATPPGSAPVTPTEAQLVMVRGARAVGDAMMTRGEKYSYDASGRVLSTTDALGFTQSQTYNALGDRITFRNKNGHEWDYRYDRIGRLRSEIFKKAIYQLSNETAPGGERELETRYEYDALGNLKNRYEAYDTVDVRMTTFMYDRLGRQTEVHLPGYYSPVTGRVERTSTQGSFRRIQETKYDALGNVVLTRTRSGASAWDTNYQTFDRLGRLVHGIDAMNYVTAFTYNVFDEQRTMTRHSLAVTGAPRASLGYWTAAEIATQMTGDTSARTITAEYDNLGRKTQVTQPTATRYYFNGANAGVNPYSVSPVSSAGVTKYAYTVFGDLLRESVKIDDSGASGRWRDTRHYYDVMGRSTHTVDALGYQTERTYDAFGNLTGTIEYANAGAAGLDLLTPPARPTVHIDDRITTFIYDTRDQQREIQRKGLRYSYRSGDGYADQWNDRNTATTVATLTYDGEGRVTSRTDAMGSVTTTMYNAFGQVTKVIEPKRQAATTPSGSATDPFRNRREISPMTEYALNAFGQVVTQRRSAGVDANGTPIGGRTLVTENVYDFSGNLIATKDARGSVRNMRIDHAGRVTHETQAINVTLDGWRTQSHTIERRYAYDKSGQQIAVTDVYNDEGVARQSGKRCDYNAFGEQTAEYKVWGAASSALMSLDKALVASFTYSKAGELITRVGRDGVTQYYYDLTGQMTRQEQVGAAFLRTMEIGYDVLGRAKIQRLPRTDVLQSATFNSYMQTVSAFSEQSYDRWGNVTERRNGGYVILNTGEVKRELESVVSYAYNADDQLIAERLPTINVARENGSRYDASVVHELRYDILGRVVDERDRLEGQSAALRTRIKEYDALGQLTSESDYSGRKIEYVYDEHGNRVGTLNALGVLLVDAFDANGNVLSRSVIRRVRPDGKYDSYDSRNLAHHGQAILLAQHLYDQANRRVGSASIGGSTETSSDAFWSYVQLDERGLVRASRTPGGRVMSYGYDEFGNRTSEIDGLQNGQTWTYSKWDYVIGELTQSTVRSGSTDVRTTTYQYNEFGQLAIENHVGMGSRSYAYHGNGLLRQIIEDVTEGTFGEAGGQDFLHTVEISNYDYTVKGERARETYERSATGEAHVFDEYGDYLDAVHVTLPGVSRTVTMNYDALGRLNSVRIPPAAGTSRPGSWIIYTYDEFGNRRNILATYERAGGGSGLSNKWFHYDDDGRMTAVDLAPPGTSSNDGTYIEYDEVGRRRWTSQWTRRIPGGGFPIGDDVDVFTKTNYAYNDLGHLTQITAVESYSDGRPPSAERPVLTQELDKRGLVLMQRAYGLNGHRSVTSTTYNADGQVFGTYVNKYVYNEFDADNSSAATNWYDAVGNIDYYTYEQGGTTEDGFIDTYDYEYTSAFGGYKETLVTVTSTMGPSRRAYTESQYDARGRLVIQRKENGANGRRMLTFSYDNEGRILTKRDSDYINVVRTQDYYYGDGHEVASVGNISGNQFSNGFTPISASYPGLTPGSYVVAQGDSLASIAMAVFGDSRLWYLIADANNISASPNDPLPASEHGKSYAVPNVVSNLHNDANTFAPYNAARIIGDSTPYPPVPVPSSSGCTAVGKVLAAVVITAVAVAVTAYTGGAMAGLLSHGVLGTVLGGAVGAAAGNASGQLVGMGLGVREDFDAEAVGMSAAQGAVSSAVSLAAAPIASWSSTAGELAAIAANQAGNYGLARLTGQDHTFRWRDLAGDLAGAYAGARLAKYADLSTLDSGSFKFGTRATRQSFSNLVGGLVKQDVNYGGEGLFAPFGAELARGYRELIAAPTAKPRGKSQVQSTQVELGDAAFGAALTPASYERQTLVGGDEQSLVMDEAYAMARANPGMIVQVPMPDGDVRMLSIDADGQEHWESFDESIYHTLVEGPRDDTDHGKAPDPVVSASANIRALLAVAEGSGAPEPITSEPYTLDMLRREIAAMDEQERQREEAQRRWSDNGPLSFHANPALSQRASIAQAQSLIHDSRFTFGEAHADAIWSPYPRTFPSPWATPFAGLGGSGIEEFSVRTSVGDAYMYDGLSTNNQHIDDLDRLGRAGYTEIHMLANGHGSANGRTQADDSFKAQYERAIVQIEARHPGLKVHMYSLGNPADLIRFAEIQADTARHRMPGAASLYAICWGVNATANSSPARMSLTLAVPRDVNLPKLNDYGSLPVSTGLGLAFGALDIYQGTREDNAVIASLNYTSGGSQILGQGSLLYGMLRGSERALAIGRAASTVGNAVAAPLVALDIKSDVQSGNPYRWVAAPLKAIALRWWPAAVAAVTIQHGIQPTVKQVQQNLSELREHAPTISAKMGSLRSYGRF